MVLVKVWSTDKTRKKLLNITNGEDLKRQAIQKGLARDPTHVRVSSSAAERGSAPVKSALARAEMSLTD